METIETMPPYVLPNQTKPNRTTENEDQVYIWKQLKRCHPVSDFDSLAVASRPLGCLHLQRVEAGIKSSCFSTFSHLTQVKGKGEMMTYYVDLTEELFLVEKRRHGDEEEEEEPWEEQRFY